MWPCTHFAFVIMKHHKPYLRRHTLFQLIILPPPVCCMQHGPAWCWWTVTCRTRPTPPRWPSGWDLCPSSVPSLPTLWSSCSKWKSQTCLRTTPSSICTFQELCCQCSIGMVRWKAWNKSCKLWDFLCLFSGLAFYHDIAIPPLHILSLYTLFSP